VLIQALNVGPLQACCYLVAAESGDAAIIDPGGDADLILSQVQYHKLTPRLILATHGHIDHIGALPEVRRAYPDAQLCIHEADAAMLADAGSSLASMIGLPLEPVEPDRLLADGEGIALGPHTIEVLHTPGHTPGGVAFLIRRTGGPAALFSGDTLFAGGIGRTDFPGGSHPQLLASIRGRLFALPPDTVVYPGHGDPTTIEEEQRTNPFLR
jgi:glyoxylase-like metal-dependent hydrolase (beta-lactamase superfamily II)